MAMLWCRENSRMQTPRASSSSGMGDIVMRRGRASSSSMGSARAGVGTGGDGGGGGGYGLGGPAKAGVPRSLGTKVVAGLGKRLQLAGMGTEKVKGKPGGASGGAEAAGRMAVMSC